MSPHHRSNTAEYQPLSQDPTDDILTSPVEELEVNNTEDELTQSFVAQEIDSSHDPRIRWIHFILGCAVLLPWNGA